MNIKHVLIVISSDKKEFFELSREIEVKVRSRGIVVECVYSPYDQVTDKKLPDQDIDLVIVVGGDGTTLRASRMSAIKNIPIFPINKGRFGFINEILENEWEETFQDILDDNINIGEYHLLELEIHGQSWLAFNDFTIASAGYGTISASLYRDKELITNYRADGVIFSTPTGSTAHSLSAGGPIIAPGIEAFMIIPIAPFSLSNRPLILPIHNSLLIKLEESRSPSVLVADGRVILGLLPNSEVKITDSKLKAKIIHSNKRGYFEILRKKLGWAGEFRA